MSYVHLAAEICTYPSSGKVTQVQVAASNVDEKGFLDYRGARLYHPPTNSCGTSGHVKWYPGMWYDPKLTKYDISAQLMGKGCIEDFQYLMGTTHFDDEDGLLYVTQKVYERRSPVGKVILVSRFSGSQTPVHVEDIVRLTGEVLEE